jgi:hypothetical protein
MHESKRIGLPALVVGDTSRGSAAASAASRGRHGAACAEGLLAGRSLARVGGVATEGLGGAAEAEVGAADVERACLRAAFAVRATRRRRVAIGDAVGLAVLVAEAALSCARSVVACREGTCGAHTLGIAAAAVGARVRSAALLRASEKRLVGDTVSLCKNVVLLDAEHGENTVERGARSAEESKVRLAIAGADRHQRQQACRHGEEEWQLHVASMCCRCCGGGICCR